MKKLGLAVLTVCLLMPAARAADEGQNEKAAGRAPVVRAAFEDGPGAWSSWQKDVRKGGSFAHDPSVGNQSPGSLRIDCDAEITQTMVWNHKQLPAEPGRTYEVAISCRTEGLPEGARLEMSLRWADSTGERLSGVSGTNASLEDPRGAGWQQLRAVAAAPIRPTEDGPRVGRLQCIVGVSGAQEGRVWLDDFRMLRLRAFDFDDGVEGWDHWPGRHKVSADCFRHDADTGRGGPGALRIHADGLGAFKSIGVFHKRIPVERGASYVLEGWVRSEGLPIGAGVRASIRWADRNGKKLPVDFDPFRGATKRSDDPLSTAWQRMRIEVTAPSQTRNGRGAAYADCHFVVREADEGHLWIDDVRMVEKTRSATSRPDDASEQN